MQYIRKSLSDIVVKTKYVGDRDSWESVVSDYAKTLKAKYQSEHIHDMIDHYSQYIVQKKVLPSMRMLQFNTNAIEKNNIRVFNCCSLDMDSDKAFSELCFLLISGCGVGISVQKRCVNKLPVVQKPKEPQKFYISDTIEGWADAIRMILYAYLRGKHMPVFDYSDIRKKGTLIKKLNCRASGPGKLMENMENINKIFHNAIGRKLTSIEVFDICCHIADSIVSGEVRSSAMLTVFDLHDPLMLNAKNEDNVQAHHILEDGTLMVNIDGIMYECKNYSQQDVDNIIQRGKLKWYIAHPNRRYSNNSIQLHRKKNIPYGIFRDIVKQGLDTGTGEPAVLWTDDESWYCNPCNTLNSLILTDKGYVTFKQALEENKPLKVWIDPHTLSDATAPFKTGEQMSVTKIVLSNGLHLEKTPNHKQMKSDGSWVEVSELVVGDVLASHCFNSHTDFEIDDPDQYQKGYDYMQEFIISQSSFAQSVHSKGKSFKLGLIDKLLGEYDITNMDGCGIELVTCDSKIYVMLETLCNILNEFGIYTKLKFDTKYYPQFGVSEILEQFDKNSSVITEIIPNYSVEDVYDITVDNPSHSFIDNSTITHNCAEISFPSENVCNLTTIPCSDVTSYDDFLNRCEASVFFGTLQAGFTDFHYLRYSWIRNARENALLGCSLTGLANQTLKEYDIKAAVELMIEWNKEFAKLIGINPAKRITCIKPEGSSSLVAATSGSGIHSEYAKYYLRSVRVDKTSNIGKYVAEHFPSELCEMDVFDTNKYVVMFPIQAYENSLLRNEDEMDFLQRIKFFNENWIQPGHIEGANNNNVSSTLFVKKENQEKVIRWLFDNRNSYTGISYMPYDNNSYMQAPYAEISQQQYEYLSSIFPKDLDFFSVTKEKANDVVKEINCTAGQCEIVSL